MNKFMKLMMLCTMLVTSVAFAQQGAGAIAPAKKKSDVKVLTRGEFDTLLAKPEQLLIIDVRRPDELTEKGGFAVYLSIQAKDLEKSVAFIPKDRAIVTVSNHAGRATSAADLLTSKGFRVVGAIGAETYEQEGGTLTKITAPAPKIANAGANQ